MAFFTGNYCHRIGVWDLGSPLRADTPTFGHYFTAAGYDTVLCGRTHMAGDDRLHGFGTRLFDDMDAWRSRQAPRRTPEARRGSNSHVTECGPGPGAWYDYDTTVADLSVRFLNSKAAQPCVRPWLLYSGLMYPHFPLTCPPRYYRRYDPAAVTPADLRGETLEDQHPAIRHLRYFFRNDEIVPEPVQRRALASYYGLVTLVDDLVGRMLAAIDDSPLRDNTVVLYVSDHGEMAGQHGIWQKQCFYEASVRTPMILRTPHGAGGRRIGANVSLVDVLPTLLDLAGIEIPSGLPGTSLARAQPGAGGDDRVVFSEYHAQGMLEGGFMIKRGDWKYNYYVGHEPATLRSAHRSRGVHRPRRRSAPRPGARVPAPGSARHRRPRAGQRTGSPQSAEAELATRLLLDVVETAGCDLLSSARGTVITATGANPGGCIAAPVRPMSCPWLGSASV